ncbi:MAG: hypothetical protein VX447_11430 [Pseudomonadota bacterium]|uniref:hypothetical protein n=1 Tax=Gallaecimonas pentaromativorans TaxID=584787 RepID=UPI00067F48F7|nr:hypothetical protein [Gallaecimonas pentaromativorans]MED5525343.1 hypothetical protein [Pseudomonadota bacterium]
MLKAALTMALTTAVLAMPAYADRDEQRRRDPPQWQNKSVTLNNPHHMRQKGEELKRQRFAPQEHKGRQEHRRQDNWQGQRHEPKHRSDWQGKPSYPHWQQPKPRYHQQQRPRYSGYTQHWHPSRHHYYVRQLPRVAVSFVLGGLTFYSAYDSYYRWYPSYGYYGLVDPSEIWAVGTVVSALPPGAIEVWVAGTRYYAVGDVYFLPLRGARHGRFVVVAL